MMERMVMNGKASWEDEGHAGDEKERENENIYSSFGGM